MIVPRVDLVLPRGNWPAYAARVREAVAGDVDADVRLVAGDAVTSLRVTDAEYVVAFAPGAVPLPGAVARMLRVVRECSEALVLGAAVPEGDRARMQAHTRRQLDRAARFPDEAFVTVYGAEEVAAVLCRRAVAPAELLVVLCEAGPAALFARLGARPCRVVSDPVAVQCRVGSRPPAAHRARAAVARLRARPSLALALPACAAALGLEGATARLREARERLVRRLTWRVVLPALARAHDALLGLLADWPLARMPGGAVGADSSPRVAYYAWRFPVLSETFVRREFCALEEAGVNVVMLADAPGASGDAELAALAGRTRYVLPATPNAILRDLAGGLVRAPLRTANVFLYALGRRYDVSKALSQDVRVFLKAVRVAAMMRRERVTHLHAPWGDTNAFVGMMAARMAGAGFSVQFRAQDLHRDTLAFAVGEKIRHARFVVTNARYNLERLRALAAPEDHAKIHVIYEGVEVRRLQPARREGACGGRAVRILAVARLIEPKGLPDLFAACRILRDAGRDLRCTVIGGPELPRYVNDLLEIRGARARLGLEDVVELAGAQPFARVVEAYAAADLFVLPCVRGADGSRDVTPNAILEAMAMGVPVVATRTTGIPELVEDGESGLLVPTNDAASLAAAIARLIDDPALGARLATNARARVVERFDVAENARAYAALFGAR